MSTFLQGEISIYSYLIVGSINKILLFLFFVSKISHTKSLSNPNNFQLINL